MKDETSKSKATEAWEHEDKLEESTTSRYKDKKARIGLRVNTCGSYINFHGSRVNKKRSVVTL